jgi:transcription antitermination factor NusA-like protein
MNCVFVQCRVVVAKAKERVLLLFKQIKPEKDGVPHLYTVTIPKMKIKLFNLAIRYTSCGTSFRMVRTS